MYVYIRKCSFSKKKESAQYTAVERLYRYFLFKI